MSEKLLIIIECEQVRTNLPEFNLKKNSNFKWSEKKNFQFVQNYPNFFELKLLFTRIWSEAVDFEFWTIITKFAHISSKNILSSNSTKFD